jgi:hypothetical protein
LPGLKASRTPLFAVPDQAGEAINSIGEELTVSHLQ